MEIYTLIIEDGGGGYLEHTEEIIVPLLGATSYDGRKMWKIVINGGILFCCANKWNAILVQMPILRLMVEGDEYSVVVLHIKRIQADILILNGGLLSQVDILIKG